MRFFCILCMVTCALVGSAHATSLEPTIASLIQRGMKRGWVYSVTIADASTGRVVYGYNSTQKLIPASNQKLITLLQALRYIGSDYRPRMEVLYTGEIRGGCLRGDLLFRGNGAIVFTSRFCGEGFEERLRAFYRSFRPLGAVLKEAGIQRVEGRVLSDAGSMGLTNHRYPAAIGLLCNENTVETFFTCSRLQTIPPVQHAIRFSFSQRGPSQSRVESTHRRHPAPLVDRVVINTTSNSCDYWRIEKSDKQAFFNDQVKQYLQSVSIDVGGQKTGATKRYLLGKLPGLSVRELAGPLLQYSDNLRAEMLYNYLLKKGKYRMLRAIGAYDGSGLSRLNQQSSIGLVGALRALKSGWPWVYTILAQPGKQGTLRTKYLSIRGLRAKTGTLDDVVSLSGFLRTTTREYIFSIIINKVDNRQLARKYIGGILAQMQKGTL